MPQSKVIALMEKAKENPSAITLRFVAIESLLLTKISLTSQAKSLTVVTVAVD
jgi:hypothetical protein